MAEEEKKETPEEGGEKKEEGTEGKEEGKDLSSEEYKEALKDRDGKISSLETVTDELGGKIDTLQESLDTALEELALKGGSPEAEDREGEREEEEGGEKKEELKKEEEGEEKELEKKEPLEKKEGGEEEKIVEKEIEKSIKEDQDFRDNILMREEVRDLKDEVKDALEIFPNADEEEIYLGIEDGVEEDNPDQIEVLAKASHERRDRERSEMKNSLEDELKGKLKKEEEGGISVPQSPGSPSAPQKSPEEPPKESAGNDDSEWESALEKSKAEGE